MINYDQLHHAYLIFKFPSRTSVQVVFSETLRLTSTSQSIVFHTNVLILCCHYASNHKSQEVSNNYQLDSFLMHVGRDCKHFVTRIEPEAGACSCQVRDCFQRLRTLTLQTGRHVVDVDNTIIRPKYAEADTHTRHMNTDCKAICRAA